MLYDRLRVFVSSKMAELAEERAVVKDVLDELNVEAWVFEHDAGARPETIQASYREQLEAADLYVGLFWKGYGDYTVDEYEHAQRGDKDCLVYVKGGIRVEDRDPRLTAFLQRIGKVESGITAQFFDTPEELAEMVKRDTARWQTRIVRKYREEGPKRPSVSAYAFDPNLGVLLAKVKQFWIEGVLTQAMGDLGLVDLDAEPRPDAVDHPVEAVVEKPFEGSEVMPPGRALVDLYDELQGSLLVLGQAGSGKTTTALRLTRDLVTRAERDAGSPVPVFLNLSTWTPEQPSLLAWLSKEISGKYQVPRTINRAWLEAGRLVLVLDGLDEVAGPHRNACAAAINRHGEEHGIAGLIVTSRADAYEALDVRLETNGAISLRPLSAQQIAAYLDEEGTHLEGLKAVLKTDPVLQDLAQSPLMLSVMSRAYRDQSADELRRAADGSAEARRSHLFQAYVDRMVRPRRGASQAYSREATMSWLSTLARQLTRKNRSAFLIEDMQPDDLPTRTQRWTFLAAFSAVAGLVLGAVVALYWARPDFTPGIGWNVIPSEAIAWLVGFPLWLFGICAVEVLSSDSDQARAQRRRRALLGHVLLDSIVHVLLWLPFVGVTLWLGAGDDNWGDHLLITVFTFSLPMAVFRARRTLSRGIRTSESLRFSWAKARGGALWGVIPGLLIATLQVIRYSDRILHFAVWPVLTLQFGAIVGGFTPRVVKGKTVPNQGMILTLQTCLRAARLVLIPVATTVVIGLCAYAITADHNQRFTATQVIGWTVATFCVLGPILALWFGGLDVVKHYVLRSIVAVTRLGPWRLGEFLRHAVRLNLLQRVGGSFIFFHRLLLGHFAGMDLPPPNREDIRPQEDEGEGFRAAVVALTSLGLVGVAVLGFGLWTGRAAAIVAGACLLGVGAHWLLMRSAMVSALRATDRRDAD